MKLLQVITSLKIGGAEKLIVEMCQLYRSKGLDVDILLFDGCHTGFKQELIDKGFTIYQFAENKSVYNPLYIFKLRRFLNNYDIVHTHNTACQYFVALAKALFGSRARLVTTEHNTTNRRRSLPGFKYLDRFIYRRYDAIIAVSDKSAELLAAYLGPKYKIASIANGINVDKFAGAEPISRQELGLEPTNIVVTMVAGFRVQKDQDTAIRALALLSGEYVLCLVGDGERRELCRELAQELGVESRVKFLGVRSDIPEVLKAADVVLMSSHWEGLSLSNLEGMSVMRPFVASDVDGLREITSGAGELFEHRNHTQLAQKIEQLTSDKHHYRLVAERCYERARCYDLEKTVNSYIDIYKSL